MKETGFFYAFRCFSKKYFSFLLIFLALLFIFRPTDTGLVYNIIWQVCFTGVVLCSVFNCNHKHSIKILTACIAIPALLTNWLSHFYQHDALLIAYMVLSFSFIIIICASIVVQVILRPRVNLETLRGVLCVYFMIGFAFTYVYLLIEYLVPGSLHYLHEMPPLRGSNIMTMNIYFSQVMYYSFITLLTIGYGNIHAMIPLTQTLTIIQGTIGEFYVAILISRIIALYSFYSHKEEMDPVAFAETTAEDK